MITYIYSAFRFQQAWFDLERTSSIIFPVSALCLSFALAFRWYKRSGGSTDKGKVTPPTSIDSVSSGIAPSQSKEERRLQSACDFIAEKAKKYGSHVSIQLSEKKVVADGNVLQHVSLLFRSGLPTAFIGPDWIMNLDVNADCGDSFLFSIHQHMEEKFGRTPQEEEAKILAMIEPVWARSSYRAYKVA